MAEEPGGERDEVRERKRREGGLIHFDALPSEVPSCKVCPLSAISRRSFSNFNTRYLIPNDYFSHAECNISFQTIPNAQFPSKRSIKSYGKNFFFNFQTIVTAKKMVFNRDHKSP